MQYNRTALLTERIQCATAEAMGLRGLLETWPLSLKGSLGHGQQRSEQETEPVFPEGLASSFLEGETGI